VRRALSYVDLSYDTAGILLHGPPGTGKTLLARQIGKMLNVREPKIENGPEILRKYVGQSEEYICKLFEDAEKEVYAPLPQPAPAASNAKCSTRKWETTVVCT